MKHVEKLIKKLEQMGFRYYGKVEAPAGAEMLRQMLDMENVKLGRITETKHFFSRELANNAGKEEIAKHYADVAIAVLQREKPPNFRHITLENPVALKDKGRMRLIIEMIEHPEGAEKILRKTLPLAKNSGEN